MIALYNTSYYELYYGEVKDMEKILSIKRAPNKNDQSYHHAHQHPSFLTLKQATMDFIMGK